jgi:PqqD family protein of HPr-rel-A system
LTAVPTAWQTSDYADLLHEELTGEHFLFNPHTGHTHVVNTTALLLLESLADRPLTTQQLAQRLHQDDAEMNLDELRLLLQGQLEQLQLLGLVESRP